MSCPNFGDIPAAVLLKNPGVTREEFQTLLNHVFVSDPRHYPQWESKNLDYDDRCIHQGLFSLAHLLQLPIKKHIPRNVEILPRATLSHFVDPVLRIYQDNTVYTKQIHEVPSLSPDELFDWSKKEGLFSFYHHMKSWSWVQHNGKYYLDTTPPSQKYTIDDNWTDDNRYSNICVAANAIENKAWILFGTNGFRLLNKYFEEFEDARFTLARAHRVYWAAMWADQKHPTREYLHLLASMGTPNTDWVKDLYTSVEKPTIYQPLPPLTKQRAVKHYPPRDCYDLIDDLEFIYSYLDKCKIDEVPTEWQPHVLPF